MEKQTAGHDQLGDFAPQFAELNMMFYLVKFGRVRTNLVRVIAA